MQHDSRTSPEFSPSEQTDQKPADPQLPAIMARNRTTVERGFWRKLLRVAGRVPFAEEAAAAYFCATDRQTPTRVRATLLAALAYFVLPADLIPDFIAGLGFSDDATVLMTAVGIVSSHIKPRHQTAARKTLGRAEPPDNASANRNN